MKYLLLFIALLLHSITSYSQPPPTVPKSEEHTLHQKKLELLVELQSLEADSKNLLQPLALASAKTEIARAAWTLDRDVSRKLLREAFHLTLPPEAELIKLRNKPAGSLLPLSSSKERLRETIRRRVLEVAHGDQQLHAELFDLLTQSMGKYEGHKGFTTLAEQEIKNGNLTAATSLVLKAIDTDPTYANFLRAYEEIAKQDRKAGDAIALQYLDRIRAFPLSEVDQSRLRSDYILNELVFGSMWNPDPSPPRTPPGPAVMRAWVTYHLDRISGLDTAALQRYRRRLLTVWGTLQTYAPDLKPRFLELEVKSRRPDEKLSLPEVSMREEYRKRAEAQDREALNDGKPHARTIRTLIDQGKFDQARTLINKLEDGDVKTRLTERVNSQEAISLAKKGEVMAALRLIQDLNGTSAVYPVIISQCAANKDQQCATAAVYQAMRQAKNADPRPPKPPAGIPASVFDNEQEADPVVRFLGMLAHSVAPFKEELAFEVLEEYVQAANRSQVDTEQGFGLVEGKVFKTLAPLNQRKVSDVAYQLKDRLSRIAALSAVLEWKGQTLAQSVKETKGSLKSSAKR